MRQGPALTSGFIPMSVMPLFLGWSHPVNQCGIHCCKITPQKTGRLLRPIESLYLPATQGTCPTQVAQSLTVLCLLCTESMFDTLWLARTVSKNQNYASKKQD